MNMNENFENNTEQSKVTDQVEQEVKNEVEMPVQNQDKMTEEKEQNDSETLLLSEEPINIQNNQEQTNIAEELANLQDKYLRLAAEYDNYQKRTHKERIELIKNAGERTVKAFLPVVDDFNRMLLIIEQDKSLSDTVKEGFSLIQQKFTRVLAELGVKEIEAVGKKFDSTYHEAVGELLTEDENQKGTVLVEVEKGYFINDKILRYSKVLIGK